MKQSTIDKKIFELVNLRLKMNKAGKVYDQKYVVTANGEKWQKLSDKEAATQVILDVFGM